MVLPFTRYLFLTAMAHLTIELCINYLPVVYPLFINKLDLNYTQVGLVALVAGVGTSLTQPLFGYLSDRWGAQRLTILSIVWVGLVMGLVGFTWSYPSLLLSVGLGALGSAAFHPAGASLALSSSSQRRGAAISIFSVGGNLGTALSPLWIAIGLSWLGLNGTVVIIPVALLVSLFLYWQLVHRRRSGSAQVSSSQPWEKILFQRRPEGGVLVGLALIIIAVMGRSWFQVTLMTYLPEWIQSQGRSLAVGGQILSAFLISIGVGGLIGGALSDRIGYWQVLAISLGLLGPAQWFFLAADGYRQVLVVCVMGMLIGATFPVSLVMAREVWPDRVGLATSLVMGLGWAPGGLGASVTGVIADHYSLTAGLRTLTLPPLAGFGCILGYAIIKRKLSHQVTLTSDTI